jgi:transposase
MGKPFSRQFKEQAIALATAPGVSIRSVAKDLGVRPQTLEYWIKHPPGNRNFRQSVGVVETNDPVALKLRLKEAEARIRRLEMEQEILKKATAFFARENL